MQTRYRMKYRPAGFATLPPGLAWNYVEAPKMFGLANRPDLPISRHTFGVFTTDRPLSERELADFEIEVIEEPETIARREAEIIAFAVEFDIMWREPGQDYSDQLDFIAERTPLRWTAIEAILLRAHPEWNTP